MREEELIITHELLVKRGINLPPHGETKALEELNLDLARKSAKAVRKRIGWRLGRELYRFARSESYNEDTAREWLETHTPWYAEIVLAQRELILAEMKKRAA